MNIDYQDIIDRYLLHEMTNEERLAFEKELNSNDELKEQFEFTKNVQQVIKSRNEKLAAMREWQDDYTWQDEHNEDEAASNATSDSSRAIFSNNKESKRSSMRRTIYWISGIAALFIAGVLFFHHNNTSAPSSPTSPSVKDAAPRGEFRSGGNFADIQLLLNQKNYNEALSLTEQNIQQLRNDSISLVQNNKINEEQKRYKMLIVADKHNELKWYKACALYGLNKKDLALQLLDELRQKDSYYKNQADSMYNKIKK